MKIKKGTDIKKSTYKVSNKIRLSLYCNKKSMQLWDKLYEKGYLTAKDIYEDIISHLKD